MSFQNIKVLQERKKYKETVMKEIKKCKKETLISKLVNSFIQKKKQQSRKQNHLITWEQEA